jgi:hypothetical protein
MRAMNETERAIKLPCFGIEVRLASGPGGTITSDLKESCDGDCEGEDYNHAIDGIEALILGHACAGIDIETSAYIEGIESAVQGAAANI